MTEGVGRSGVSGDADAARNGHRAEGPVATGHWSLLLDSAPEHHAKPLVDKDVTVVVPTHNDGSNIGVLLEVLLAESRVAEVVVAASECSDETCPEVIDAAARCNGRVRLYVEPRRSGKFAAVNLGIHMASQPFVVIVSGDVLPEPGAVDQVAEALNQAGVGLSGGRPVPVNADDEWIGHGVHLLWELHHRLALRQPKLGEVIAIKAEAAIALPTTSVDEAMLQALLERQGWRSVYVPGARIRNRGPSNARDLLQQRRQVHAGHVWLRRRVRYTVPSLRHAILFAEVVKLLRNRPSYRRPRRLAWTAATLMLEAAARFLAHVDYLQRKEIHVWKMVESAKAPASGAHRLRLLDGKLVAGNR
jgi:hypothetical protein